MFRSKYYPDAFRSLIDDHFLFWCKICKKKFYFCAQSKKSACNGELQNKYEYLNNGIWETFYIVIILAVSIKHLSRLRYNFVNILKMGACHVPKMDLKINWRICAKTMLHNKASGETKIFQWMIYLRRNMTLFVFVRHTMYNIYLQNLISH